MPIDQEKLRRLQNSKNPNRIGGKGSARRKHKTQPKDTAVADSKKLQLTLRKIVSTPLDGIDEVNMFKDNGEVIHFTNPQVFCAPNANTFTVAGMNETKKISEMPQILNQLGLEGLQAWAKSAQTNEILSDLSKTTTGAAKRMGIDADKVEDFDVAADDVE